MRSTITRRLSNCYRHSHRPSVLNRGIVGTGRQERQQNVGILAMETYIPKRCVKLEDLETYDKVSKGKYSIGLGQERMAFVGDREDINSIALSCTSKLLEKYNIDPQRIGRLEVGTETLVDKSKSTKTVLMELLGTNSDVEGATCLNACYGGTAALLNSVAWIDSAAWDGRYALVVTADIAVYEAGPARPTGGAGAVAMLIGPDAPLPLSPWRHTHAENCWDFYKPRMDTEYPAVDGPMSNEAYLRAVDICYTKLMEKALPSGSFETFDYYCFHSPYNKLVQKSLGRIMYNDFVRNPTGCDPALAAALAAFHPDKVPPQTTYSCRDLDKALKTLSAQKYKEKCTATGYLSKQIGNSYTAAMYVNLLSLVSQEAQKLENKKVFMFSYGSGSIATSFAVLPRAPTDINKGTHFTLKGIADKVNLKSRLAERTEHSPEAFRDALALREIAHDAKPPFKPTDPVETVSKGDYYLQEINDKYHRIYAINT
eukprot:gb/GEZN01007152.1/.p1 GENE.gb/GEZN01007152.1/~~gb/GEZN01007152.1/.p1  ORF type:complete len:485 (+),score=58.48 gb/GEZN01007152.1/:25-1479(+)